MSKVIARKIIVSGKVQKVGFRAKTFEKAREIGDLTGWVQNLNTGDVEVMVQGPESKVQQMLVWLRHGPTLARVDHFSVETADVEPGSVAFEIRS